MRPWIAAVLACATLAACSPDADPAAGPGAAPSSAVPTSAAPSAQPSAPATTQPTVRPTAQPTVQPSARPTATTAPRTDLKDGRQVGYFKAISTSKRTLTVDVAQWLEGAAAEKAWKEDGNTEEMPFSFYIRNQNTKLRTLPFAPGVTITVNTLAAEETGSSSKDVKASVAKFASYFGSSHVTSAPFHFTLKDGVIVAIREQFIP